MNLSLIPLEIERQHSLLLSLIQMIPLILWCLLCTHNYLTYFAIRQMTSTGKITCSCRCLLDEFANIGLIPKFEKLIATIRSREISASIILQAQSQLKAIYKDNADTIVGNCDSTLFLGGKEKTTLKELSETLGKETIDLYNTSETRSNANSYGLNYQKTGKELMSQDEITVMDGSKCIFQLRGVRPFCPDKFDITKHKITSYLKILIRKMPLILRNISSEKGKQN